MRNWTLAVVLGSAVTSTMMGIVKPALATTISGPGGGGTFSQVGNNLTWNEYFTGVGPTKYLDKVFTGAAANQTYDYTMNVRNDSGLTWKYFQFDIIGSQAETQVNFFNPPGYSSAFTTGTGSSILINWTGGSVADDGGTGFDDANFWFQVKTGSGFQGNTVVVRQYPTPAQPSQLTWLQWSSGNPLKVGDKTVTYKSHTSDFAPDNDDTVKIFNLPNEYIVQFDFRDNTSYKGTGSFTYKIDATAPFLIDGVALGSVTTSSFGAINKYVCAASQTTCDNTNKFLTLTSNNGSSDPALGHTPIGPARSFVITDQINYSGTPGESVFQINNGFTQVPEPLTILGTGVVLGALPFLKKEYGKKNKKKDGDA